VRQFARPFPIDRLSLEARVLYTGFLVFLLLGLLSSVWLYADSFGDLTAASAQAYYRGGADSFSAPDPTAGGPMIDLPGEAAATSAPMRLEKPPRQLMETFHFHLFTVPIVLLVVGHLFMLTSIGTRSKIAVISVASGATLVHLIAPLMIRFGSARWAPLMPLSVVAAAIGWLPMLAWPLWEMWRPRQAEVNAA
jgi:hypothetical protein